MLIKITFFDSCIDIDMVTDSGWKEKWFDHQSALNDFSNLKEVNGQIKYQEIGV
jgi:hypothetical protein